MTDAEQVEPGCICAWNPETGRRFAVICPRHDRIQPPEARAEEQEAADDDCTPGYISCQRCGGHGQAPSVHEVGCNACGGVGQVPEPQQRGERQLTP